MRKNGFTLIELLAVIVILAIIALIATPAVLNIIEDSRKGAAEASARNIVSAAKTYYMSETMNGRTVSSIDLSGDTLKYDGDQASKGSITFTNGKPSGTMYIGGYCVTMNINGNVTSEKKDEEDCEIPETAPEVTTYTKYNDGYALLYDPVNNVKCLKEEVTANYTNYKANNSYNGVPVITGYNDGCMKWYAFLDSEESSTVKLLLDHNITNYVAYNANGGSTPDTVNAKLQEDITNWNEEVKSTARLISATEVNEIAPTKENWNISNRDTFYFLHTGKNYIEGGEYTGSAGSNTYAWLFDNTAGCAGYGCYTSASGTYGYWTSSFSSSNYAWYIDRNGILTSDVVTRVDYYGVRPVIEVSKSIFE